MRLVSVYISLGSVSYIRLVLTGSRMSYLAIKPTMHMNMNPLLSSRLFCNYTILNIT